MPLRVGAKKAEIKSACLLVYGFGITSRQNQNGFGFHQCAAWQRCHANGGASRVGDSEVLLHHGVEGGEVGQIGEVGVELNDVVQAAACGFTHGTQVFEHLVGLGFKVVAHQLHGIGHEGDLPAEIHGVACVDGLAVCADGGGGLGGVDNGFAHDELLGLGKICWEGFQAAFCRASAFTSVRAVCLAPQCKYARLDTQHCIAQAQGKIET